jgi:hypothetical protein
MSLKNIFSDKTKELFTQILGNQLDESVQTQLEEGLEKIGQNMAEVLTELLEKEVEEKRQAIVEEYATEFSVLSESLKTLLKEYLAEAKNDFIKSNSSNLIKESKIELVEDFYNGLKDLFQQKSINLDENQVKRFDEMAKTIETLQESVNQIKNEKIEVSRQLKEAKFQLMVEQKIKNLSDAQSLKFKELAEGLDVDSDLEFKFNVILEGLTEEEKDSDSNENVSIDSEQSVEKIDESVEETVIVQEESEKSTVANKSDFFQKFLQKK